MRWLNLSHNNFSGKLDTSALNFIKHDNLNFRIDLSSNKLSHVVISDVLEEEMIQQNFVKIDLHDNPLTCNCDTKIFEEGENKEYKSIQHITLSGLEKSCRKTQPKKSNCIIETSVLEDSKAFNLNYILPLGYLFIGTLALVVVVLKCKRKKTEDEWDKKKLYDVFLSYCHQVRF